MSRATDVFAEMAPTGPVIPEADLAAETYGLSHTIWGRNCNAEIWQSYKASFLSGARWQQNQIVALIEARAATYLVSEPEHRALIQLAKIVRGEPQPERVK